MLVVVTHGYQIEIYHGICFAFFHTSLHSHILQVPVPEYFYGSDSVRSIHKRRSDFSSADGIVECGYSNDCTLGLLHFPYYCPSNGFKASEILGDYEMVIYNLLLP